MTDFVTRVAELWPERRTSDAEMELLEESARRYPRELWEAALVNHKSNYRGKSPNVAVFRSTILAMAENYRGVTEKTGAAAKADAERAKWAEWHFRSDSDDEITRSWIGSLSDAEIVGIAERAIEGNSPMLIGIFGDASADARLVQRKVKGVAPINPERIRQNFFARGMLRAFAEMEQHQ